MRNIDKSEPQFFVEFKEKYKPKSYVDDCNEYELRDNLRQNMLDEHHGQCFYCEKKITNSTKKVHIDHIIQRQSNLQALECDYNNIVLSCNGEGENYCGKYKDKQYIWDNKQLIRLVDNDELKENPSTIFLYQSNGKMKAKKSPKRPIKTDNRPYIPPGVNLKNFSIKKFKFSI